MLDQIDAGYGHDSRHKEHTALLEQISSLQSAQIDELKTLGNQNRLALIEAEHQHRMSMVALNHQTLDVVTRLNSVEQVLGAHLDGIRSALGNIDDRLGAVLKVLVTPLGTKAAEFTRDGNNALINGFVDEAVAAFEKALEYKQSDYVALSSLAFAKMRKGETDASIEYFRKAVAYVPPEADAESKAIALENLARAHYVKGDYGTAYEFSAKARETCPERTLASEYRHIVYAYLTGAVEEAKAKTQALCAKAPGYFVNFSTDPDLEPHRPVVLGVLDELAQDANQAARTQLESDGTLIEEFWAKLEAKYGEHTFGAGLIKTNLGKARNYVNNGSYTRSLETMLICVKLKEILPVLEESAKLRKAEADSGFPDIESRFIAAKSEWELQKREFENKKKEDLEIAEGVMKAKEKKRDLYMYIALGLFAGLWLWGMIEWAIKEWGWGMIILIPIALICGAIVALIIVAISRGIASLFIRSGDQEVKAVQDRSFDVEFPEELRKVYQAAREAHRDRTDRIKSLGLTIDRSANEFDYFPAAADGLYFNAEVIK